jgi:hypothetical protein
LIHANNTAETPMPGTKQAGHGRKQDNALIFGGAQCLESENFRSLSLPE